MFKGKSFWYLLMAGSLGGWVFAIAGRIKPIENATLKKIWKGIYQGWVYGHPLELAIAFMIGKARGLSTLRIIAKTLAFGFTWWLPLKLGVFKK